MHHIIALQRWCMNMPLGSEESSSSRGSSRDSSLYDENPLHQNHVLGLVAIPISERHLVQACCEVYIGKAWVLPKIFKRASDTG
jgi:hypothetical protein